MDPEILNSTINQYYFSQEGLRLTEYSRIAGHVTYELTEPLYHNERLDESRVEDALDEVSRTLRLIEHGGNTFEIATANEDASSDDVMLHISTYSSAISTNPGNAYEFAAQAVRYPNAKHVYVASFGNGGTSPLHFGEALYARRTGRFLRDNNGVLAPIPSIHNLHVALQKEGLAVTKFLGTDSAGGHYGRALAADMEPGQLSHAFFSETSGFVHLTKRQIIGGMLVKEMTGNAKLSSAQSPDAEKMDDDKKARATAALKKHEDTDRRKLLTSNSANIAQNVYSMYNGMQALRRGPTRGNDPLVSDTNVLLARHPDALVTYGLAEFDPLYLTAELSHIAAQQFLTKLVTSNVPVRAVMIPGMSHSYNTHFPSLYHAIKRRSLDL